MTIQDDVIRLYKSGAKRIVLSELEQREPVEEARGVSTFSASGDNSQLQSPLTEISRTVQAVMVPVPEAATEVEIEVITSVTMKDARGYDYVLNFEPPAA